MTDQELKQKLKDLLKDIKMEYHIETDTYHGLEVHPVDKDVLVDKILEIVNGKKN